MKINNISLSLQGEGVYTGEPTIFVRLQGCNLVPHCTFCDTTYSQDPNKGEDVSVGEVVRRVSELAPWYNQWVCITGGEPLWQSEELEELVSKLKEGMFLVTVETNGSFKPPRWYTKVSSWSADIKCPSSGVCGASKEDWFGTRPCDQIKFVVGDYKDLEFTREVLRRHPTYSPTILISPMLPVEEVKVFIHERTMGDGETWEELRDVFVVARPFLQEVWNYCIENRVRWSFQNHKIVWGNKKGV